MKAVLLWFFPFRNEEAEANSRKTEGVFLYCSTRERRKTPDSEHTFSAHSRGIVWCWTGIVHGSHHSWHDMSRRPSIFLCSDFTFFLEIIWIEILPPWDPDQWAEFPGHQKGIFTNIHSSLTFQLIHQSRVSFINLSWSQEAFRD